MPSRDPVTGKRYCGSQQRALKALRQGKPKPESTALAKPTALVTNVPTPPNDVDGAEAWAAMVNLRASTLLPTAADDDLPRLIFVGAVIQKLAKLRRRAVMAEKYAQLRRLRLNEHYNIDLTTPPTDPALSVLWAWFKLCAIIYQAATGAEFVRDVRLDAQVACLVNAAGLPCEVEISKLMDELEAD